MNRRELLRLGIVLAALAAGCQEPGYRTEVVGNGQGGVEIQRVPADAKPAAPPRPAPAQSRVDALESQVGRQQQYIDALQRRIQQQDEELRKLKGSPTTTPAP
jgi:hypothetical protein